MRFAILALLTLLFSAPLLAAERPPALYDQLCAVNPEWKNYGPDELDRRLGADAQALRRPTGLPTNGDALVRLHLEWTEKLLRSEAPEGLSAAQQARRAELLDALNGYMRAGRYPQNTRYSWRTPIFIDDNDVFCAVGFLMKTTGEEAFCRNVRETNNLVYVREIESPAFFEWAETNGFSVPELALIQPAYAPQEVWAAPAGVKAGRVTAVTATPGSPFTYYAELSETGAQLSVWNGGASQDLGLPWPGKINAIARFDEQIIAAGTFESEDGQFVLAKLENETWTAVRPGMTTGEAYALEIWGDRLFVGGDFQYVEDIAAEQHLFAYTKENPQIFFGGMELNKPVRALQVYNDRLYAGGDFSKADGSPADHLVSYDAEGRLEPVEGWEGDLYALESFSGKLLAGGALFTAEGDTLSGLAAWDGESWENLADPLTFGREAPEPGDAARVLFARGDVVYVGGQFEVTVLGIGVYGKNLARLNYVEEQYWNLEGMMAEADGPVLALAENHSSLYVGGTFTTVNQEETGGFVTTELTPTSRPKTDPRDLDFRLYPNPTSDVFTIALPEAVENARLVILDVSGRELLYRQLAEGAAEHAVSTAELAPGVYLCRVQSGDGVFVSQKFTIAR